MVHGRHTARRVEHQEEPWSTSTGPKRSTIRRIHRYAAAAALAAFPALLVVQAPIDPASGGTGEVMYAAASEQAAALLASAVLLMVSGMLMVPAVAGLVHLARGRGAALATFAAVLGVLGGFGHFGIGMFYLVTLALPGGDPGQMAAYVDRLNALPALTAIAFPLILCFGFGVVAMSWAAWRIGLIGWWGPVLVTAVVLMHQLPDQLNLGRNRRSDRDHRRIRLPRDPDRADERHPMGACPNLPDGIGACHRVRTWNQLEEAAPLEPTVVRAHP